MPPGKREMAAQMSELSEFSSQHLEAVAASFEVGDPPGAAARAYRRALARHFRYFVAPEASVLEVGCGGGDLLSLLPNRDVTGVDLAETQLDRARQTIPHGVFLRQAGETLELDRTFDVIVVSDTLNLAADVQQFLARLQSVARDRTRLVINFQNQLWRPLLEVASALGLRRRSGTNNWLASADVANLAEQSGWETVRRGTGILCPVPILGLDRIANRLMGPFLAPFCLSVFMVARPRRPVAADRSLTVSVIIPARNEAGNIEAAVLRTPAMGAWTELIFVEGHSRDHTWKEIERVKASYPEHRIKILRQTGKGKGNAVREGFAAAEGDVLMILDADLTTPPEELPKFFEAIATNRVEFANGSRLVYPMEKNAMRFLNMCANKVFGLAFTWLLGQQVKDTLCGTKALHRTDYEKIAANRAYFGDFDPFGDFDLLFGASKLGLKIADIPVRYRERTYGETNIHRWRHGWLLLRMVVFASKRMKLIG